jgi:hypothetical protein
MDERIERAALKVKMVEWALTGMAREDQEPKKADLENVLLELSGVRRDLDQAIEAGS